MKTLTIRMLLNSCVRSQIDIEDMPIEYRTYDEDGNDIFTGICTYKNGELIPVDHGTYSLDDEIEDYQMFHDEERDKWTLTVWYTSSCQTK